jgi:hypothetical protein
MEVGVLQPPGTFPMIAPVGLENGTWCAMLLAFSSLNDRQDGDRPMKSRSSLILAAVLALATGSFAQDAAHDVNKAAKKTAHTTKTAAKKTAHGTEKAADQTATGTKHVAKTTGHGVKKGTSEVGHGVKKTAKKTEAAVK